MEMSSEKSNSKADEFPAGLRVLVVDDSSSCLIVVEKMLQECRYNVSTCTSAEAAHSLLCEKKDSFDVVLCDVHMPEKNGFEFLQELGPEVDVPVVMMSSDFGTEDVMRGIEHGASAFLIKPVRIEDLRNLWMHCCTKKEKTEQNSGLVNGSKESRQRKGGENDDETNDNKETKKRKGREYGADETDDTLEKPLKKKRMKWSPDLEEKFLKAIIQTGIKAGPKKILDQMKVDNLSVRNVSSHLQKFRNCIKRYMADGQTTGRMPPQVLKYFSSQMSKHCNLKLSGIVSNVPLNSFQSAATNTQPAGSSCFDMDQISTIAVQPLKSLPVNLNDDDSLVPINKECNSMAPYAMSGMNNYSSLDSVEPSVLDDYDGFTIPNFNNILGSKEVNNNINFRSLEKSSSNVGLLNNHFSPGSGESSVSDVRPSNRSSVPNLGNFQTSGIETEECNGLNRNSKADFADWHPRDEVGSLNNYVSNYGNLLMEDTSYTELDVLLSYY